MLTQSLELTHAFKIYDADKNGTMDAKEFKQVLKDLGKRDVTDEQVTGLLAEVDKNGDSVINWNEFLEVGCSNSVNGWFRCSSN